MGAGREEGSRERRSRGDMQEEGRAAGRDEGTGRDDGAGRNESGRQTNTTKLFKLNFFEK